MRKNLLLAFLCILSVQLMAQTCIPDPIYADTTFGVFPGPYDDATMTGGIPTSACINEPYEFVLTAVIPDTVEVSGFVVALNSVTIDSTGAVQGLPVGMTYACNPPNCVFQANTQGCIIVHGTATAANTAGEFPLVLNMTIDTGLLGPVPTTYPGDLFPGSYSLLLEEEGSPNCSVVGVQNLLETDLNFSNSPNPFADYTQVNITSGKTQSVVFEVSNLIGQRVHSQPLDLMEGENRFDFDGSQLANGMYIYSLKKGNDIVSKRMIVQK